MRYYKQFDAKRLDMSGELNKFLKQQNFLKLTKEVENISSPISI